MDEVRREREEKKGKREKVKCHKMFGDNKRMKGLIQSFS
jgi:hypothetical protein